MQLSLNVLHNEVLIYSPLICTKFKLRRIEVCKDKIQTYICNNGYAEHEKNLCSLLKALETFILKSCMHVHI